MIKLKEILQGKKKLNESTYVKGKLNVLLKFAKEYLFKEGDIGNQTFFSKWTKQGIINNVTQSQSKDGTPIPKLKFAKEIDKAFDVMRKDVEKAHAKWEKSVIKATKPFDKEYTGV